jgi:two-component system, chemotaxis family, chemotaxis protein CheY
MPQETKLKKALVVDDSALMRTIVTNCLLEMGISEIDQAEDGDIAYLMIKDAQLGETPYGIVVSDWYMPNMKGIELLHKIRSEKDTENLPFVLVTAEGESQYVLEAMEAKASGIVVKPFSIEKLKEKVGPFLKNN